MVNNQIPSCIEIETSLLLSESMNRKPTRHWQGIVLILLALILSACGQNNAEQTAPRTQPPQDTNPRQALTEQALDPALRQAIDTFQDQEPNASFTFLRGHVDAFSNLPKDKVPAYAAQVLKQFSQPTTPRQPALVDVTTAPMPKTGIADNPQADLPYPAERNQTQGEASDEVDEDGDAEDEVTTLQRRSNNGTQDIWYEQDDERLAKRILAAFLREHRDVFVIPTALLEQNLPNLKLGSYGVGKHFRRAEFEQFVGDMPLRNGKTIVLFDLNWNVTVISRQLVTQEKLGFALEAAVGPGQAQQRARNLLVQRFGGANDTYSVVDSQRGIDLIRGLLTWDVSLSGGPEDGDYTVTLNARSGELLNISDDSAHFNDAQVKHWEYVDGNMDEAYQVIDSNFYTHDDNTLVHDFFYLVNDDRNDGGTGDCNDTPTTSSSTPDAYTSTSDPDYVRPTRRPDRNFTLWRPKAAKGSFGESQVYYWARNYMQWQKQALIDLGVLTVGNFNNYTKALIIVNACRANAGEYKANYTVSTYEDKGEGLPTILLPDRCRLGNDDCTDPGDYADANSGTLYTFEDSGGYHFPSVIHHELNHFVLIDYFDVSNSRDCSNRVEQKYFQEGGIGRTLPQMYWHHYYGVGYEPATTNHLFRSAGISGRPHVDSASLNHLDDYPCFDGAGDPYSWGGVVAQPMWEIYHGVDGSDMSSMARPALDLGMIKSMYYAADLTAASSFSDREEFANQFMAFWDLFSTAQPSTKTDWCSVWQHHGVGNYINSDYCD